MFYYATFHPSVIVQPPSYMHIKNQPLSAALKEAYIQPLTIVCNLFIEYGLILDSNASAKIIMFSYAPFHPSVIVQPPPYLHIKNQPLSAALKEAYIQPL